MQNFLAGSITGEILPGSSVGQSDKMEVTIESSNPIRSAAHRMSMNPAMNTSFSDASLINIFKLVSPKRILESHFSIAAIFQMV